MTSDRRRVVEELVKLRADGRRQYEEAKNATWREYWKGHIHAFDDALSVVGREWMPTLDHPPDTREVNE